ncbi:AAA family ATPase, partial [Streptomyces sp. NPDC049577]|uniref:AAA family ATPase n=1 Tax=Streptomyces sp. NPDC049577 TaxID=3155153 RepID=UPI00341A4CF5
AGTRLVVLRGNSGSGKTTVARAVRERYGSGLAIVSQDTVRREILCEAHGPVRATPGLIDVITRQCLDEGFHVILEGIFTGWPSTTVGRVGSSTSTCRSPRRCAGTPRGRRPRSSARARCGTGTGRPICSTAWRRC